VGFFFEIEIKAGFRRLLKMSPTQHHPCTTGDQAQPHHPDDPAADASVAAPISPPTSPPPASHGSPGRSLPLNPNATAFSSTGQEGTSDWLQFSPSSSQGGKFSGASPASSFADVVRKGKVPTEAEEGPRKHRPAMPGEVPVASSFIEDARRAPLAGSLRLRVHQSRTGMIGRWWNSAGLCAASPRSLPLHHRQARASRCRQI
jgi:hypothetical protein